MERRIIIGLISSTEYLQNMQDEWNPQLLESSTAKLIAKWCWKYYNKYKKAPMYDISDIYMKKLNKGLDKDVAEEIEHEILPSLNEQAVLQNKSADNLLGISRQYFKERQLILLTSTVNDLITKGEIDEAQKFYEEFMLIEGGQEEGLDFGGDNINEKVDAAFNTTYQSVITFPGALGDFWNSELVKGAFVAILAPEKRGKTFLLLEFMMQGFMQDKKVAFFQAGDMTENQQIIRTGIYLAKKSNKEKFCGVHYVPVQDCKLNQTDQCDRKIRECEFGIFESGKDFSEVTYEEMLEVYHENKHYKPCHNCLKWQRGGLGAVYLEKIDVGRTPLGSDEAKSLFTKFFGKYPNRVKLSTHPNGTLSIPKMKSILAKWKREDNFEPEMILLDYADLVVTSSTQDPRHQVDYIWRNLRGESQELDCLVVSPTQADAKSYEQDLLSLKNFSEDKRKFAHVTAMYGLNQDTTGREKKLGIMRINKMVVREDSFHNTDQVTVLQKLQIGRPVLGSYF